MCNCKKNNKPAPTPIQPKSITVSGTKVIGEPIEPPYTREEINRVHQYFTSRQQTQEERMWVVDFHNKHFPEKFGYNIQGESLLRMKRRLDHLSTTLTNYEREEQSWETEKNSQ